MICDVLDDACLPGGAFAVARMVPESETRLGDFATWDHEGLPPPVIEDGALTARVPEAQAAWGFTRTVAVIPGKHYALRAAMRRDASASGYLVGTISSTGTTGQADAPAGDAWEVVVFEIPADGPELTVAFYSAHAGASGGAVQLKEVVLLELDADYGQYWRVTLVDPPIAGTYESPFAVLHGGTSFYSNIPPQPLAAGLASPWFDMAAGMPAASASFGLVFRDEAGNRLEHARVRLEVAWRPDDASVLVDQEIDTPTGAFGLVGSSRPNPLHLATRMVTVADYMAEDPTRFRARPGYTPSPQPIRLASISDTNWVPDWGDPAGVEPVFDFFADLGLNGVGELAMPEIEAPADAAGLDYRYVHIGPPLNWVGPNAIYAIDTLPAELEFQWESQPGTQANFARLADAPDRLLVDMCDEAYGFYFIGDPTYQEALHDFLKTEVLACADPDDEATCTPEAFGKASWDEVVGFGRQELVDGMDASKPDPSDVAAARLYYWRVRFWNEATARVYGETARFLADKFGGDVPPVLGPNMGSPFGNYGGYRQGLEFQTVLKAGAMTGFHGEAFLSFNDHCWAQHLSEYADWVDGEIGAYGLERRSSYVHFTRGAGAQKALALAAHGIPYIDWYTYGPSRLTTGDGIAGRGQTSMDSLQILQDGSRALAIAEPGIAGMDRVTGPVAMVAAQTDPIWWNAVDDLWGYTTPLAADETGVYLALTHGHHPVRFLVEERLVDDLGPDTEVLLLQRRHLSNAAFAAIQAWVEAGGTLLVIGQLPALDELAQPVPARLDFLGTDDVPLDIWTPTYTVRFADGTAVTSAYPRRPVAGGTVLATYDDGGAAVVEVERGAGRIRIAGFLLGRGYLEFAEPCLASSLPPELGRFPVYQESVRDAVLQLVGDVDRPAWTSEPLVELVRMAGEGRESLVLINYSNVDQAALEVTVPGWEGTTHALFADVDVAFTDGVATLPLGDVEVLELLPEVVDTDLPVETDLPVDTEVPRDSDSDAYAAGGCGCSSGRSAGGWALVALVVASRRRRAR